MEQRKSIIPTILLIVVLNIMIISTFWYITIDSFDTYETQDKDWLTFQEAKAAGLKVTPDKKYYHLSKKIVQRTKSKIPLVYVYDVLEENEGYYSEELNN